MAYYADDDGKDISQEDIRQHNDKFLACIEKIKTRHDPTTTSIGLTYFNLAQGVMELKTHWRQTDNPLLKDNESAVDSASLLPTSIQSFLDRFYMSRMGIRMLLGQHISMSMACKNPSRIPENYVGVISTKINLSHVVEDAIANAKQVCCDHYGLIDAPPVRLLGDTNLKFMYVPGHLHHMLFELLKNSMRAVVDRYGPDCDDFPEIRIIVAEGNEDITIKISDEGGGIARSGIPLIWTYMYTTATNPFSDQQYAPLAGFGYGLPLSRLYARYFGGDLRLISMEGYGTDAYLHLSRLSDSSEPLPY